MRIAIIMFARGRGGVEAAFVSYCEGLRDLGHQVVAVTAPNAAVNDDLAVLGIETHSINNWGEWDIFAVCRLRKLLLELKIDAVIAHANRAFALSRKAIKGKIPLVGVVHNYNTRRYNTADAVFTITHDLIEILVAQGLDREQIFHIPNMVDCCEIPHRRPRNNPPVIGTMGRFVAKKGFDIYIDALAILKKRGINFRAVLGGDGIEAENLKERAQTAGIADKLLFVGWVKNKKAFYTGLDIFCLPSLHEPFGIVLLEAFVFGTPVIATDSEGPKDIITPNYDALIVEKGNAEALADALTKLLQDNALADKLAANAFVKAKMKYSIEVVCLQIETALNIITSHWRNSTL